MNCRSFRKHQAELLDACPDPITTADLLEHAAGCSKCGQELRETQALLARITPSQRLHTSQKVKERIMNSITELDATNSTARTVTSRRPIYLKFARAGVLAAILLLAIVAVGQFTGRGKNASPAFASLAQAAEFVQGVKTMHISARMRTLPIDNFDHIDLNAPLIPVEMWRDFGNPSRMRIEKQGRQIVADGNTTTLLVQPDGRSSVRKLNGTAEGLFLTLAPLLHADTLFERESEATNDPDSTVTIATKIGSDGRKKTILTISAKAKGDFSESDYAKNKSIIESDNVRIYTFDAEASRCESVQVYVRTEHGIVLVFETTRIEYDIPLNASLFHLDVPKDAIVTNEPSESSIDNSWMQPDEFAREFFEALSRSDWKTAVAFGGAWFDTPESHKKYDGLDVISVGKPFKSGLYPGWLVPYEIKLKGGDVKKWNLAVRNDNPDKQWKMDGGL